MLGLALLFALLLDSLHVRLARFSRIAIFLPYAVPGVVASLLWGFLYLPGVSPIRRRAVGWPGPRSTCWARGPSCSPWPTSPSGAASASTCWCCTPRCAPSPATTTRPPGSTAPARRRSRFRIKIPILMPAIDPHDGVLRHRHDPGFHRAHDPPAADQHDQLHLEPADEGLPGRVRHRRLYSAAATAIVIAAISVVLSFGFLRVVRDRAFREELMTVTAPRASRPVPAGNRRRGRRRRGLPGAAPTTVLLLGALYCLFPVSWVLIAASKSSAELFSTLDARPGHRPAVQPRRPVRLPRRGVLVLDAQHRRCTRESARCCPPGCRRSPATPWRSSASAAGT